MSQPVTRRPPRPLSIEIAAAILIVGGFVAIVGTLGASLGLLVRRGQAWIVCINVVAVLLFIELTAVPGGSAIAALLAVLDGFVFVALARNRAWFEWQPPKEIPAR